MTMNAQMKQRLRGLILKLVAENHDRQESPVLSQLVVSRKKLRLMAMGLSLFVAAPAWPQRGASEPPGKELVNAVLADRVRLRWDLPLQFPAGGFRVDRDGQPLSPVLKPISQAEATRRLSEDSAEAVVTYLKFLENPAIFATGEQAQSADTLQFFVLFKSTDDLEIARALGILYDDTTAASGSTHVYTLLALDAQGQLTVVDKQEVRMTPTPAPASPSAPALENTEDGRVGIGWQKVPSRGPRDPAGYHVYRATSASGPFQRINPNLMLIFSLQDEAGKPLPPTGSYVYDTEAEDGTTYYYHVTGVDFFGRESAPSEAAAIEFVDRCPPLPVESIQVETTPRSAKLMWSVPAGGRIATIRVSRSEAIDGPFEQVGADLPGTATSFTDDTVFTGRKYFYRVETESRRGLGATFTPTTLAEILNPKPPAARREVKAEVKSGQVSLSWQANPEPDLDGYRVYRGPSREGEFELISPELVHDLSFTDQISPELEGKLWYRVSAVNTSNAGSAPAAAAADLISAAAPAPPALTTGAPGIAKITLEWQAVETAAAYLVYRSVVPDGGLLRISEKPLPAQQLRYEDSQVDPDGLYYYAVQAVNARGVASELSNMVSATALPDAAIPPPPAGLRAEFNASGQPPGVTLTWQMPQGKRYRCAVFRSESRDGGFRRIANYLFEEQITHTDTSAAPGKTYYYTVRTRNPAGHVSEPSAPQEVRVPAKASRR